MSLPTTGGQSIVSLNVSEKESEVENTNYFDEDADPDLDEDDEDTTDDAVVASTTRNKVNERIKRKHLEEDAQGITEASKTTVRLKLQLCAHAALVMLMFQFPSSCEATGRCLKSDTKRSISLM